MAGCCCQTSPTPSTGGRGGAGSRPPPPGAPPPSPPRWDDAGRQEGARDLSGSGGGDQCPERAAGGAGAHVHEGDHAMTRANVHLPAAPLWLPALAPLVAGCFAVTINVTFPQEKIDSAASGIEDLVRMPAPSVPAPAAPKRDGSAPTPNQPTAARFAWMGPALAA